MKKRKAVIPREETVERKEIILKEALRLFSERGYAAVSVEEIAAAVGIKAPSLYNHFKGKKDIFDSIVRRMELADASNAEATALPAGSFDEMPDAYRAIPADSIRAFSKAMFRHWTEEEFGCRFRRLLTVSQYGDPAMAKMHCQYLSSGPVGYMADIFRGRDLPEKEAYAEAVAYYAPMYLMYGIYDSAEDKEAVLRAVDAHIDGFFERKKERKTK